MNPLLNTRRPTFIHPLLMAREISEFRKIKANPEDGALQVAVNECVREGCSVERMKLVLKRAGFSEAEAQEAIDKAYPAAAQKSD